MLTTQLGYLRDGASTINVSTCSPVAVVLLISITNRTISDIAQTSTTAYFQQMIALSTHDDVGNWVRDPLLEGYVTSAGAGSETVLRASREAFSTHTNSLEIGRLEILCTHVFGTLRTDPTIDRLTASDRLNIPTLDFLAFLCDSGVLHRLSTAELG